MIEVVFGESAYGSLKVAQGYRKGKYQLGISDVWIAERIEKMIDNGELEVISETPEAGRKR